MATYAEIYGLFNDSTLQQKVAVALLIAAEAIRQESDQTTNHANRIKWAKKVQQDPNGNADDVLKSLLAQNASATVANIQNATDAAIQTAVNNVVNVFADGT